MYHCFPSTWDVVVSSPDVVIFFTSTLCVKPLKEVEDLAHQILQYDIDQKQVYPEKENGNDDDQCRPVNFLFTGPGHLLELRFHVAVESNQIPWSVPNLFQHKNKWQARRDSNPQHPVLETGALPIGATGLRTTSDN